MPLQNRVSPSGEILAVPQRGTMMGNRGGRFHDPASKRLHPTRRWVSRQWICCVCDFKGRQREVMGNSYTELFFLDEVTAFAAGHRPCFECRRADALAFAKAVGTALGMAKRPSAPQMDKHLHAERLSERKKAISQMFWRDLPDGAAVIDDGQAYMKCNDRGLAWSFDGYQTASRTFAGNEQVSCLTPPLILAAFRYGYAPKWHPSADDI